MADPKIGFKVEKPQYFNCKRHRLEHKISNSVDDLNISFYKPQTEFFLIRILSRTEAEYMRLQWVFLSFSFHNHSRRCTHLCFRSNREDLPAIRSYFWHIHCDIHFGKITNSLGLYASSCRPSSSNKVL